MLVRKIILSTAAAFLIATPLVCFTDILAPFPYVGPVLASSFWHVLSSSSESSSNPGVPLIAFAGPICIVFMLFWYLWIQRNKRESILAVVARAQDVHKWLRTWAQAPEEQSQGDLKAIRLKAQRLFRRLDRLVSLEDSRKWHSWYTVYLALFYPFNASKIMAFSDVRVEPPAECWPTPVEASDGLDSDECELLEHAMEFSGDFTDGAKASTGLNLMLHTIVGGTMGLVLSVIVGGALSMGLTHNLGVRAGQILFCLTFALAVGLLAGYCWYWVCEIRNKNSRSATTTDEDTPSTAVES